MIRTLARAWVTGSVLVMILMAPTAVVGADRVLVTMGEIIIPWLRSLP